MSESHKPNSWSRTAAPQTKRTRRAEGDAVAQVDWRLAPLTAAEGPGPFGSAMTNPFLRLLGAFARRRMPVLALGLLLVVASGYCLAAPQGSTLAGLPVEVCSIALAGAAILLALLVTVGAWLRPLASVEDAMEVLGVPLIAFEKGGTPDVR